jgi:hypothetical protein
MVDLIICQQGSRRREADEVSMLTHEHTLSLTITKDIWDKEPWNIDDNLDWLFKNNLDIILIDNLHGFMNASNSWSWTNTLIAKQFHFTC